MQCEHIRRTCGGVKAGPLTCPDAWSDAWPSITRTHGGHRRNTRTADGLNLWGLTDHELAAEIAQCRADGWASWEIRVRFGRWAA